MDGDRLAGIYTALSSAAGADRLLNATLNRMETIALFRSASKVLVGLAALGIEAAAGRKRVWSLR